jgi:hypothetical protein
MPSEVVCNPHTILFNLPDVNKWCATYTPLHLSFCILLSFGGILSSNSKNEVAYIRKNTFALELLRTEQNLISTQEHLQAPRSTWEFLGASGKLSDIPQYVDVPICFYVTPRKS